MPKKATMKFRNPNLPVEERVKDLVSRMTLKEKALQMLSAAPAIPRLGIPKYDWWNEALHGVGRAGIATVFPQAIGMGASFDPSLMQKVATAISDEARAKYHAAQKNNLRRRYMGLTYWSPNINIFRDPRWGRGQETYGEDPYLTGRMGTAFVKGLQGNDRKYLKLVATPKHYAVHSGPEGMRHGFDARASKRDMYETYLPAFKACVQEGKAESIMGAYNRTNGESCCASKTLLLDILRHEWGFGGYVVSDCGAIADIHAHHKITKTTAESSALAVKNGCDLNCGQVYAALVDAVKQGLIDGATIDRAVSRLMSARIRLGMFDPDSRVPYSRTPLSVVNCEKHRKLSRRMACESIVLAKNNGVLPLSKDIKSIQVLGPNAADISVLLGNYFGASDRMVTILEGIIGKRPPGLHADYRMGCMPNMPNVNPVDWGLGELPSSDVGIAVMGLTPIFEGEEGESTATKMKGDREDICLPKHQEDYLRKFVTQAKRLKKPSVAIITSGCPVMLPQDIIDSLDALLYAWYPGEEGGNAVADVLFGDYNPSGRFPITVPKSLKQLPPFTSYAMKGRTYRFMKEAPQWMFGYGLSYTTFSYSKIRLSKKKIAPNEKATVSVDVKNTGKYAGEEVVQLYVSDVKASVPVPKLHLEGFKRIYLKPKQKKTVCFMLKPQNLACYDNSGKAFVEPGNFKISVGGGQPGDKASGAVSAVLTVAA